MTEVSVQASELPLGHVLRVELDGEPIAVAHTAEGVFAIGDTCSHAEVSLAEGELRDCALECWMHGASFDLRTGQPLTPPATTPVPTFNVRVAGSGDETVYIISAKEAA